MSVAKGEQESTETLSFRCDCERCRLMRGRKGRFAPQDDMSGLYLCYYNGMNYYFVYILTNQYNTTFYIGVTNDLLKRVYQHKNKIFEGFTSKYNVNKLVYFEYTESIEEAIFREKQLKKYNRNKKIALITNSNPTYKDLYEEMTKD